MLVWICGDVIRRVDGLARTLVGNPPSTAKDLAAHVVYA